MPVLKLAFVRIVPVLVVRGSASYNGDFLVPVLKLAFMRSMPVLVRGSAILERGLDGARTKTGIRARRASSSTGLCQF